MATSGIVKSWVHSKYNTYYSWEWTSTVTSAGVTTVTWKLYGKGRTTGSNWFKNECKIDVTVNSKTTTIYTLKWSDCPDPKTASNGTNISFNESQSESFRTEGSFTVTHNSDGAASFDVNIFASFFDGTGTGQSTTTTVALETNKPKYTLTLTKGTGISSVSGNGSYAKGTAVTVTAKVSDGYLFTNWQDSNGKSKSEDEAYKFTMPGSALSLTATARKIYKIEYIDVQTGYSGQVEYTVKTPAFTLTTPEKPGYTFTGWTGNNGSTKQTTVTVDPSKTTDDLSYTANWTPNEYTVRYNGNTNTNGSTADSSHKYDTAKALTANGFTKSYTITYNANGGDNVNSQTASYTFAGWAETASGSVKYSDKKSVINLTSDKDGIVNLYAKWSGGSVTLPTPTRKGYTFNGWYTNATGGTRKGGGGDTYTATSAVTLYAQWTAKTLTITCNKNGGTGGTSTFYVLFGSKFYIDTSTKNSVSQISVPTRTGYTFGGYNFTNSSGNTYQAVGEDGTIVLPNTNWTVNPTIDAVWNENVVKIYYYASGGSVSKSGYSVGSNGFIYKDNQLHVQDFKYSNSQTGENGLYNASTFGLSKTGYHFGGWKVRGTNSICDQDTVYPLSTFTQYNDSGKNVSNTSVVICYVDAQWIPNTDTTYTVKHWKQNLDNTNYTLANTDNMTGTTATNTSATAKSYTGFTKQAFSQTVISADGSTVVNIYYNRNSYTLTMEKGTGVSSVSSGGTYKYGASVDINATPSVGYSFKNWTTTVTSVSVPSSYTGSITMPASNVTITANAAANTNTPYTVNHWKQNLDATSNASNTTNYTKVAADTQTLTGTTATNTAAVAKTYQGFTAKSFSQKPIAGGGTTVVDIYYTRNSYTVSLDKGTGVASVTGGGSYKYEQSVTVSATISTGYTWQEWEGTNKSYTNRSHTFEMPAHDVELTARATPNKYTITYVGQGGKQSSGGHTPAPGTTSNIVVEVEYNKSFKVRPESWAFTRTGYWFLGWATEANSKDVSETWVAGMNVTWTETSNLTLYAVWKSKGVLYVDDGSTFIPYTIWIDSGSTTGGPNNNGWNQYTAWIDTGDESQGDNGWVQLGSLPD